MVDKAIARTTPALLGLYSLITLWAGDLLTSASSPYRVMRMRLKAKGHSASPRTALDLLARIQKHTAHIGERTFNGTSKTTPEQRDLFDSMH
jgi:hypothetical protein